jgi:hypothetical protein
MASFAIKRGDGTVDKAEGASVEDVATRYGAPGNGTIEPWDDNLKAANTFATPEDQTAAWKKTAEKEGQFGKVKPAKAEAAAADAATDQPADAGKGQ